jgi:uncharacterized membrane protein
VSREGDERTEYEDIDGPQDKGRLLALSDGVFAIALTVLVLNLDLPPHLHGKAMQHALDVLYSNMLSLAVSFFVIGLMWIGHHGLWRKLIGIDRRVMILNLAFLLPIVLVPFGAQVLSAYGDEQHPQAAIFYASLMVTAGLLEVAIWIHARDVGLMHPSVTGRERDYGFARSLTLAAVFFISMPLALLSADLATWSWLILIPAIPLIDRKLLRTEPDD